MEALLLSLNKALENYWNMVANPNPRDEDNALVRGVIKALDELRYKGMDPLEACAYADNFSEQLRAERGFYTQEQTVIGSYILAWGNGNFGEYLIYL